ncbi:uncharacterized protein LOC111630184 [Centruroides sculpturatus]|uniref:uncharacterized protein LOC111630184 n=1 Tax=Centruroides sculpturatus TaxID=218467 RepID=UPI000C6D1F30|nr:uncharacterized protein LOC111630184 [Centruroides sculpturatus]
MIYVQVAFVAFMFAVLHLASAEDEPVICYVCNSKHDERCQRGKLDDSLLKNCSDLKMGSKYTSCRTIEQNIDFKMLNMEPNSRIIRQCAQWDSSRACYYRGGFGGRVNVCHCKGRGCNGANSHNSAIFMVFVCLALTLRVLL